MKYQTLDYKTVCILFHTQNTSR